MSSDPIDKLTSMLYGNPNSIKELIGKISNSDVIKLLAKGYGFKSIPPTIREFINDDFFLGKTWNGKLYNYWYEHLEDIFPNPITCRYFIVNPGGGLGIGKSSISQISALYNLCKMGYLEDPFMTFGLSQTTPFTIRCFNLSKDKANDVLVYPMNTMMDNSQYFVEFKRSHKGQLPGNLKILSAKRSGDVISECLVYSLISEANFFPKHVAKDIINTCLTRMKSRLQRVEGIFGTIVLDSSSKDEDSVVEEFLRSGLYENETKVIRASIWEVKPDYYFKNGSFKVFIGSSEVNPHIIEDNEDLSKFDPDRIIDVPNELLNNFKSDIQKSLMDSAGVSLSSTGEFYTNKKALGEAFSLEQTTEDVMTFDFFDEEQISDRIGKQCLKLLPKDKKIFGRIDLGLTGDLCGVALGYVKEPNFKKMGSYTLFDPTIEIPICFGLSRINGQETSIHKLEKFFLWVASKRCLELVSTDQFQSSAIRQTLKENGINSLLYSVDRTDTAYVNSKLLINRGRLKFVKNSLLQTEAFHIKRFGNKVDHTDEYSKDLLDACVGMVQNILDLGKSSAEIPDKTVLNMYSDSISKLAEHNVNKNIRSTIAGFKII